MIVSYRWTHLIATLLITTSLFRHLDALKKGTQHLKSSFLYRKLFGTVLLALIF